MQSDHISSSASETGKPKRWYGNSQVRKGGLAPLQRSVMNFSSFQAYIRWSVHTTAGFSGRVTRRYAGAGASRPSEPANWQGLSRPFGSLSFSHRLFSPVISKLELTRKPFLTVFVRRRIARN